MQTAVPKGIGGMVAILGSTIKKIEDMIDSNKKNINVQIANDNSEGQIVVSGKLIDLDRFIEILKFNPIWQYHIATARIIKKPAFWRNNILLWILI